MCSCMYVSVIMYNCKYIHMYIHPSGCRMGIHCEPLFSYSVIPPIRIRIC